MDSIYRQVKMEEKINVLSSGKFINIQEHYVSNTHLLVICTSCQSQSTLY